MKDEQRTLLEIIMFIGCIALISLLPRYCDDINIKKKALPEVEKTNDVAHNIAEGLEMLSLEGEDLSDSIKIALQYGDTATVVKIIDDINVDIFNLYIEADELCDLTESCSEYWNDL